MNVLLENCRKWLALLAIITSNGLCKINAHTYETDGKMYNMHTGHYLYLEKATQIIYLFYGWLHEHEMDLQINCLRKGR